MYKSRLLMGGLITEVGEVGGTLTALLSGSTMPPVVTRTGPAGIGLGNVYFNGDEKSIHSGV